MKKSQCRGASVTGDGNSGQVTSPFHPSHASSSLYHHLGLTLSESEARNTQDLVMEPLRKGLA